MTYLGVDRLLRWASSAVPATAGVCSGGFCLRFAGLELPYIIAIVGVVLIAVLSWLAWRQSLAASPS